jgi:hypothetical protein
MAKSNRQKAVEALELAIPQAFPMASSDGANALAVAIADAIELMAGKAKRQAGEETPGTKVWNAYTEAFARRYRDAKPLTDADRNAETNTHCARLAGRLGVERAVAVVEFYLAQNDAFYVRARHPLELLVRDTHQLKINMELGGSITRKAADKIETAGASLNASAAYLRRKHGEQPNGSGQ